MLTGGAFVPNGSGMTARTETVLVALATAGALIGLAAVPKDLAEPARAATVAVAASTANAAQHFWYSSLGRCAPSVRAAVERDPALWARDVRIGKCRPSARQGEQTGPIEVCMVEHLVDGARITEPLAVDCSAGTIIGLTP